MLCVDYARLGFAVNAFVRLRATPLHTRGLLDAAREIPQIIEMLGTFAQSSTSVVLGTPIPLRNPIPAPSPGHKPLEKAAPATAHAAPAYSSPLTLAAVRERRRRDAVRNPRVNSRK